MFNSIPNFTYRNLTLASNVFQRLVKAVFLCFLFLFVSISGGRLNSSDAHAQLQQSLILASTGKIATFSPPQDTFLLDYWNGSKSNGYTEKHDPGNMLLMLPASWIGYRIQLAKTHHWTQANLEHPPLLANFLVAMTDALIAALGCTYLFAYFLLTVDRYPMAIQLTLGFIFGTFYCVYAKSAWDVASGAAAICAVLYYVACLFSQNTCDHKWIPFQQLVLLICATFVVYLFRSELAVFLTPALITIVAIRFGLRSRTFLSLLGGGIALAIGLGTLSYAKSGHVISFAKTGGANVLVAFKGGSSYGLFGNTLALNHGLFIYAPVLMLSFGIFIPKICKKLKTDRQSYLIVLGIMAILYLCIVSLLKNWAPKDYSWGPRYLVTILPILYVCGVAAVQALDRKWTTLFWVLVGCGAGINVASVATNCPLSLAAQLNATDPYQAKPSEVFAVYSAFCNGITGKPATIPNDLTHAEGAILGAHFPDFWWSHFFGNNGFLSFICMAITIMLNGILFYRFRQFFYDQTTTMKSA